jgi:RNA polymerase sigma-70 factor (ECF subfamily)
MDQPVRSLDAPEVVDLDALEGPRSFERFFEAEHTRLFGTLCLVTGNRAEAEEIMQDAFLRLWERWDRVAGLEDPTGYLYRTAMNVFRNRYRRAVLALKRTARAAPTEDLYDTIDARDAVVRALRDLSADQRAAVVLTNYVGLTSEEAGRLLGMRASAVRTLATRARAAVRRKGGELG